jgi:tartrate dehydratase alpha subunit/fumarate hydratase class I-like protein
MNDGQAFWTVGKMNRASTGSEENLEENYQNNIGQLNPDSTETEDTDCKFLDSGGGCELMSFRKCDDEICPRNDMEADDAE